jgi:hypothetical protein
MRTSRPHKITEPNLTDARTNQLPEDHAATVVNACTTSAIVSAFSLAPKVSFAVSLRQPRNSGKKLTTSITSSTTGTGRRPTGQGTPFIPTVLARGHRRSLASATTWHDSSAPESAMARAFRDLMHDSPLEDHEHRLINEVTLFNINIIRKTLLKDIWEEVYIVLEAVIEPATTLPQEDPLAFLAHSVFVLFPRLVMRLLPPCCKGRHASLSFSRMEVQDVLGQRDITTCA